ncbi:MAG: helix-turn-helix domain-containing protein, partial [Flavobacterium sp.]
ILIFNFGAKPSFSSQFKNPIEIDKYLILGPIKQAFDYSLPPQAEILTLNFKNDAFYRFFGNISMAEHLPINPDELLNNNCFAVLWHELNKISDINARVNHILKFCEPYLQHRNKIAEQLANFKAQSLDSIKSVAIQNSQTQRNTQLQHKKHFGYSAKEVSRYERFLKTIDYLQNIALNTSKVDWLDVVTECGYYDQSQLIKDFKHYINLSPTKYIKFQQNICNPVS